MFDFLVHPDDNSRIKTRDETQGGPLNPLTIALCFENNGTTWSLFYCSTGLSGMSRMSGMLRNRVTHGHAHRPRPKISHAAQKNWKIDDVQMTWKLARVCFDTCRVRWRCRFFAKMTSSACHALKFDHALKIDVVQLPWNLARLSFDTYRVRWWCWFFTETTATPSFRLRR